MLYLGIFSFKKEKKTLYFIPVHSMLDDEVEESEGSDQRTDD